MTIIGVAGFDGRVLMASINVRGTFPPETNLLYPAYAPKEFSSSFDHRALVDYLTSKEKKPLQIYRDSV